MPFKIFETEEDYNKAFQDRIERERRTIEGKYADYEDLKKKAGQYDDLVAKDFEGLAAQYKKDLDETREKYKDYDATLSDVTARATKAEASLAKIKVATAYKLPLELAERISGGTDEEMKKDAETLAKYFAGRQNPPGFNPDPDPDPDPKAARQKAAYKKLLNGLRED